MPTKLGLEKQRSPSSSPTLLPFLFLDRNPPHLGVFYTVKWEKPQGKDLFHHYKTTKSRTLPQGTVYVKKNGRQSKPRILVSQRSHRKKNWGNRWSFRLPSNRLKLVTIQWVIRYLHTFFLLVMTLLKLNLKTFSKRMSL